MVEIQLMPVSTVQRNAGLVSSALAESEVEAEQACLRPTSYSGMPIIGALPGASGAFIATGKPFLSQGITAAFLLLHESTLQPLLKKVKTCPSQCSLMASCKMLISHCIQLVIWKLQHGEDTACYGVRQGCLSTLLVVCLCVTICPLKVAVVSAWLCMAEAF